MNREALYRAIEQTEKQLTDDNKEEIVFRVISEAAKLWEECPMDFCIQHFGHTQIIFGGLNRVLWSPKLGFRIDKSYCTQKFIEHYEKVMGE